MGGGEVDIRQLRYFIAVAEELHFGNAAARLHMAQPPLSQQIRQLETSLNTTLIIRTTRRVELTPAGALLLERGRRMLEEFETLRSDVRRVGEGLQGVLRLGFTGSATYGIMPRVVRDASARFPGVSLSIRGEMLTPQLVAELTEHRLDIAVLRPPVDSSEVEFEVIGSDRIVAALPADYSIAEGTAITLDMLADERFVSYPGSSSVARAALGASRAAGFVPNVVQEAKETSTLLSLVAARVGIALVPEAARAVALEGMLFREIVDAPTVDMAIAWRRDDGSPLVANFVEFLRPLGDTTPTPAPLDGLRPTGAPS